MESAKCTVLVLSCDRYSDLWDPFFKLFSLFWKDCAYPVVLVPEKKTYDCPYMKVETYHFNGSVAAPWSRRIKQCLKSLKSKYVLILMDDFFLTQPVLTDKLEKCFDWMEKEDNIACFSFVPSLWEDVDTGEYPGFEERPVGGLYRVNCQAGLWNRDKLIKLMLPYENAWDFEWMASCRSDKTNWRFFAAKKEKPWIFDYDFSSGGGVHRGKWTGGVVKIFEENGIDIDYSIRGWDDNPAPALTNPPMMNPPPDKVSASLRGRISYIIHHPHDFIKGYI